MYMGLHMKYHIFLSGMLDIILSMSYLHYTELQPKLGANIFISILRLSMGNNVSIVEKRTIELIRRNLS